MQLPVSGEMVFWRMQGVRVKKSEVEVAAKKLGLKLVLPEVSDEYALRKALEELARSKEEDIIWRKDKAESTYYVAKVNVVNGIKTKMEVTIKSEMENEVFKFTVNGSKDLEKRIRDAFVYWSGYVDSAHMIVTLVKFIEEQIAGIRVRKGGGVYFVRKEKLTVLDALEQWFKVIGGGVSLSRLKIIDEERTSREIAELFIEKVTEDMQEIKEYSEQVLKEDLRRNKAGIQSRIDRIERMKKELEMYKDVLGDKKGEVEKHLEEVKASIFLLKVEA